MLQGKGGCGKTVTASLVAQYLTETGRPPLCLDTDPLNRSFVRYSSLAAEEVRLLSDGTLNVDVMDALVERILTTDAEVVVDNGAASFLPMSRYLFENNIPELIEAAGKRVVLHVPLVGGGNTFDTAKGLEALLAHFPSASVVVWINEFFGPVEVDGIGFEQTPLYEQNRDRFAGVVYLLRQNPQTFGANIATMMDRKLTFTEALADPAFTTVPRQRLTMYRRQVWDQLAGVL